MAGFIGGLASGLSGLPGAISSAQQQKQQDELLKQQADALRDTYKKEIGNDALQRWERMKGAERMAHIKAAQLKQETEWTKTQHGMALQSAEDMRRTRIIQQNADIFRQAKEARAPAPLTPGQTIPTAWGPAVATSASQIQLPSQQKGRAGADLDAAGNPILSADKTLYLSGGQWVAVPAQMAKQIAKQQEGRAQLTGVEANLAAEKAKPKTFFGLLGGPDSAKVAKYEATRQGLVSQFGTPSAPPPAAAAQAAPAPAAAPPAAAGAGRVQVKAPDGTVGTIPVAQLQAALNAGYSQM